MKINLNFLKNKKILYPLLFVLLIAWISLLFSKTNFSKPKSVNTFPVINSPESTSSSKITTLSQITPNSNITPLGNSTVSVQNNQLTITQNGSSKNTNFNQSVINFSLDNNYIIVTTGQMYSENVSYSAVDPSNLQATTIKSDKITPITSLSISPNGQFVALLGNYDSQKNTSNLYLKNLSTNQNSLTLSKTNYNTVKYINDKQILVGYYSDGNEPNYTFGIFDLTTNKLTTSSYKSSPKTTCFNNNILAYYDFSSKSLKSITLSDFSTKEIKYIFPNLSTWLLCSNSHIYAISPTSDKVSTRKINLENQDSQTIDTKLSQTIFIQPFINNDKLVIKTLYQTNKIYQLLTID